MQEAMLLLNYLRGLFFSLALISISSHFCSVRAALHVSHNSGGCEDRGRFGSSGSQESDGSAGILTQGRNR